MKLRSLTPLLFLAGGATAFGAAWYVMRRSDETKKTVETAVQTGGIFQARLTGYYPFKKGLTEKQQRMEGGNKDRKEKPLITLEQHLKDPSKYPYVSVAGDDAVFPYGQRVIIDAWPGAIFRVVDTGGNFRGGNKMYRLVGHEPLDICVNDSSTKLPKTAVVKIVRGDNFAKGAEVATGGIRGQNVTLSGDELWEEMDRIYTAALRRNP